MLRGSWRWGVAAIAAVVTLVGCGGHSGGTGSTGGSGTLGRAPHSGTVVLPAGSSVALSDLRAVSSVGEAPVAADGKFAVPGYSGGPQVVFAVDGSGTPMLCGFVGDSETRIDARSTAEALAYFILGGYRLPAPLRTELRRRIAGNAALDPAVATIETRFLADPHAFGAVDSEIVDALDRACRTLSMGTSGHLILPTETQSGIEVQSVDLEKVRIANYYRRRAHAYLDRVSYKTSDGMEHPSAAPIGEVDVSPTVGVSSVVGALSDLIVGNSAYNPVYSDPLGAPVTPTDAVSTKYQVTVVGPGGQLGEIESLPQDRRDAQRLIVQKTLIVDLLLPLILNVAIPANASALDSMLEYTNGSTILYSFIVALTQAVPSIWDHAWTGEFGQVVWDIVALIADDASVKVLVVDLISQIITHYNGLFWGATFENGAVIISKFVTGANMALTLLDSSAQLADIARSKQAATWDVVSNKSRVLLSPPHSLIDTKSSVDLTATIPDASGSGASFTYHWKVLNQSAVGISDGLHSGNEFDSSSNKVTAMPTWYGASGTDAIEVEAFEIVGSERRSVGKAQATVEVREASPFLAPEHISLRRNGSFTLQAGMRPGLAEQSVYHYKWSVGGTAATFGGATTKETGTGTVTLDAKSSVGTDTVTVEVFLIDRGKRTSLGTATADVVVEDEPSYIYGTVKGKVWHTYDPTANWHEDRWAVWVEFDDVFGVSQYFMRGWDNWYHYYVERAGPPFDVIQDLPPEQHAFGMWGGVSFGPGPPDDSGDAAYIATVITRFQGIWEVRLTR